MIGVVAARQPLPDNDPDSWDTQSNTRKTNTNDRILYAFKLHLGDYKNGVSTTIDRGGNAVEKAGGRRKSHV